MIAAADAKDRDKLFTGYEHTHLPTDNNAHERDWGTVRRVERRAPCRRGTLRTSANARIQGRLPRIHAPSPLQYIPSGKNGLPSTSSRLCSSTHDVGRPPPTRASGQIADPSTSPVVLRSRSICSR